MDMILVYFSLSLRRKPWTYNNTFSIGITISDIGLALDTGLLTTMNMVH